LFLFLLRVLITIPRKKLVVSPRIKKMKKKAKMIIRNSMGKLNSRKMKVTKTTSIK